jgi:hypothetical protein
MLKLAMQILKYVRKGTVQGPDVKYLSLFFLFLVPDSLCFLGSGGLHWRAWKLTGERTPLAAVAAANNRVRPCRADLKIGCVGAGDGFSGFEHVSRR